MLRKAEKPYCWPWQVKAVRELMAQRMASVNCIVSEKPSSSCKILRPRVKDCTEIR
jgi:hypothetical protein